MTIPKSQQTSYGEILRWALLSGGAVLAFVGLAVLTAPWWCGDSAFEEISIWALLGWGLLIFVFATAVQAGFFLRLKWMEDETPARIADEIERKLNGQNNG